MIKFESHISGIPCIIEATWFHSPPSRKPLALCESPDEAFGCDEIEYCVFDRKDYRAEWLEKKITALDDERIHEEVVQAYKDEEINCMLASKGL